MKNRAKCKLCETVIQSFHRNDYVPCKCGEISICGGDYVYECGAKNWINFLRVDDNGNEIITKLIEKMDDPPKMTKREIIDSFAEMVKNLENIPNEAKSTYINHYDLLAYMTVVLAALKAD